MAKSTLLKLCSMHAPSIYRTFRVLKDLTCNIMIEDEVLFENDVFQTYQASISEGEVEELSEVDTLIWLNTPERFLLPDPIAGSTFHQILQAFN